MQHCRFYIVFEFAFVKKHNVLSELKIIFSLFTMTMSKFHPLYVILFTSWLNRLSRGEVKFLRLSLKVWIWYWTDSNISNYKSRNDVGSFSIPYILVIFSFNHHLVPPKLNRILLLFDADNITYGWSNLVLFTRIFSKILYRTSTRYLLHSLERVWLLVTLNIRETPVLEHNDVLGVMFVNTNFITIFSLYRSVCFFLLVLK